MWSFLKPEPHRPLLSKEKIDPTYKRLRWQVFIGIFIGYAGYYLVRKNFSLAMPYLVDMGFDKGLLGVAISANAIAYGLSKFIMGGVSDRSSARKFLPLGLTLSALATLLLGTKVGVSSIVSMFILQFLIGWFQGMGWPPCGRVMTHWFSQNERGTKMSIWNCALNVGGALVGPMAVYGAMWFGSWFYGVDSSKYFIIGTYIFPAAVALFVALLICIIRACTLEGTDVAVQILQADGSLVEGVVNGSALDGLKYMFSPGWAANVGYYVPAKAVVDGAEVSSIMVNGVAQAIVAYKSGAPSIFNVVSTAGGQMFFSLSLGMGAMITYGSYLHKKENLQKNALLIIIMDTMVALMAGLCVMPARFALDPAGNIGGPKLLFITMQNVFHSMGTLGPIFGILFYLLVVFAAISSSISLLEVIVAHFCDKARDAGKGDKRKVYSLIAAVFVGLGCILICMDSLGGAGISPFNILGIEKDVNGNLPTWCDCWLDFFDCISEGILMPLGALLMCLCIGWELGPKMVDDECCLEGQSFKMKGFFNICVKFITPLCMILVLYGQIKDFFF